MIKQICRCILKNEITEKDNEIINLNNHLFSQEIQIEMKERQINTLLCKVDEINNQSSLQIIGIDKNKNNEYFLVVPMIFDNDIDIYLYPLFSSDRIKSKILATKYEYKERHLYIDDFTVVEENIGNGSILLKYLIQYAKENHYLYISGWLSPVDKDNFDLLEHFYTKFGFEVWFNEEKSEGKIKLDLSNTYK